MRAANLFVPLLILATTGCTGAVIATGPRSPSAVVVADKKDKGKHRGPRKLKVPPGHYPPAGQCRLWYEGRPPGQQPKPAPCSQLRGRAGRGAFILYNGSAWDAEYDWRDHERRNRGSVPEVIIQLTVRM